jgi:hypothetical protein
MNLQNRYLTALRGSGQRSQKATTDYERDSAAYDPQASFETSAKGAYANFREDLKRDVSDLRGQQVSMGRLRTGYGTEDEDRLISESSSRFENTLADRAMQTEQLRYSNMRDRGNYAVDSNNTYLELLAGGMDRETAEENARRERKGDRLSGLLGLAGAGIGAVAGGPAGASLGARIGGSAGRLFS